MWGPVDPKILQSACLETVGAGRPRDSVGSGSYLGRVMLCFIEPAEAIRVMAECIGRDARRSLLAEVIEA